MPRKKKSDDYLLADKAQASKTRDRILIESSLLFAQKGFDAVTVRDIAERVHIKAASLYKHFENKEAIWDAVLENIEGLYLSYYDRLGEALKRATSFEEVLHCMFAELKEVLHIFIYYGGTMIQIAQFADDKAYRVYSLVFHTGVQCIKHSFDDCIEKGWVKRFETEAVATFFMHSVMVGTTARLHEDLKQDVLYDVTKMYARLEAFILDATKP